MARNGSKPDALREGGTELGMERDIASLLISLPLIAFARSSPCRTHVDCFSIENAGESHPLAGELADLPEFAH